MGIDLPDVFHYFTEIFSGVFHTFAIPSLLTFRRSLLTLKGVFTQCLEATRIFTFFFFCFNGVSLCFCVSHGFRRSHMEALDPSSIPAPLETVNHWLTTLQKVETALSTPSKKSSKKPTALNRGG